MKNSFLKGERKGESFAEVFTFLLGLMPTPRGQKTKGTTKTGFGVCIILSSGRKYADVVNQFLQSHE